MKEESRIVELLSEMLYKFDTLTDHVDTGLKAVWGEVVGVKQEVAGLKEEVAGVKEEVAGVKEEVAGVKEEVVGVKEEVSSLKGEVTTLSRQVTKIEREMVKLNLITAEHSRSLMKLADNNERISRLERAVFK